MLVTDHETYIRYVDNFFDDLTIIDDLYKIKEKPFNKFSEAKQSKTNSIKLWGPENFSKELKNKICLSVIKKFPELRSNNYKLEMNLFEFMVDSYITKHDDSSKCFALTCYLNTVRDSGYFCYFKDYDVTVGNLIEPIKNRCVLIKDLPHAVMPTLNGCRTTLQIWGYDDAVL